MSTTVSTRRPSLTSRSIAAAGLRVIDREGAAGFSMRSVAAEVGASPMSLYHHVADRAALVALMIDLSVSEVPMPSAMGEDWREDLLRLANWLRDSAQRHPALIEVTSELREATPRLAAFGEQWIALWRRSDLPVELQFAAANTSLAGVVAMVQQIRTPAVDEIPRLESLPNLRHALSRTPGEAEMFDLFVRALVDGLCVQVRRD